MQLALPLTGGWHAGPLFVVRKRRHVEPRGSGGKEVWAKYKRAKPPWVTWAECSVFWALSAQRTAETGVQHSVDHIVPLKHPLVCGLHCPANLRVIPLAENQAKSNNWWPDGPFEQQELL